MTDCASTPGFPWTAVISGLVGIVGALLGSFVANRAAEERLRMEQGHDDRTRFHKERIQFYVALLAAVQGCRSVAASVQQLPPDNRKEYGEKGDYGPIKAAVIALNSASNAVQLIGSDSVRAAAEGVVSDALVVTVLASAGEAEFRAVNEKLARSEAAFAEATRRELLPAEPGNGPHREE